MACINAILDGYPPQGNHINFQVYLNDLPDNDFSEVAKCIADPAVGFESHELFRQGATVSTFMVARSFYQQCLPTNHMHLSFSFNSLHWLKTPMTLSKSITLKSDSVTADEADLIKQHTTNDLVTFLNHRAAELVVGGRLILTILKDMEAMDPFNRQWHQFLKLNNYRFDQFPSVTMPAYPRSTSEVLAAIEQVEGCLQLNFIQSDISGQGSFPISALKAATYNTLAQGALRCPLFATPEDATVFIDRFYEYLAPTWVAPIPTFHLVVLERIQSNL
ncbi:hypothetical protein DSO57_1036708 [Entomophthora muscae]|uniref:Uncharacterized protein n=1 Tax=Entomophthora muscae TaxID=34485 RepID=A0ACC2TAG8_9FUNG|nr:hypothetical protein DSO57_1036708 [Entomophthora muscae]